MNRRSTTQMTKRLLAAAGLALVAQLSQAGPTKILFIGNSFTHGNAEPTLHYNAANVRDLNGGGRGGVPGIFKKLTDVVGLSYEVSMEAVSAQSLNYHYTAQISLIGSAKFDVVAMQDYSTLDIGTPGNPASLYANSKLIEQYIHQTAKNINANPNARVYLTATWARADQVYSTPGGYWNGTSIEKMNGDLHSAYYEAAAQDLNIAGINPVGDAFLMAVKNGVADRNPYDGIDGGKINLWNTDYYHASAWGSYLEALTIFTKITGRDPRTLGYDEAAIGLGVTAAQATSLQNIAYQAVQFDLPKAIGISGVPSGRCVDAPKTTDTSTLLLWTCTGSSNQQMIRRSNGTVEVHGRCLDVANGTTLALWICNGGGNQQWRFNADGTIVNVQTGLCLDVKGGGIDNNTPLQVWTCNNGAHQRWAIR